MGYRKQSDGELQRDQVAVEIRRGKSGMLCCATTLRDVSGADIDAEFHVENAAAELVVIATEMALATGTARQLGCP